jgi:Fur family ferric uptake transcriptional regulator
MSQNSSPAELREIGLKVTAPRIKVLEFFQQNPSSHYSAEEVYMALSKDDSDIGIATVYRVLTQFEQAGILLRSHFESSKGDS